MTQYASARRMEDDRFEDGKHSRTSGEDYCAEGCLVEDEARAVADESEAMEQSPAEMDCAGPDGTAPDDGAEDAIGEQAAAVEAEAEAIVLQAVEAELAVSKASKALVEAVETFLDAEDEDEEAYEPEDGPEPGPESGPEQDDEPDRDTDALEADVAREEADAGGKPKRRATGGKPGKRKS
ncbi:MAG: hypothetical protein EP335_11685 [Alphaproteobacteria bacterium]|nr:MAG: hypothetical protein EP335_11685 [Alphaproteobacteria bacterium]